MPVGAQLAQVLRAHLALPAIAIGRGDHIIPRREAGIRRRPQHPSDALMPQDGRGLEHGVSPQVGFQIGSADGGPQHFHGKGTLDLGHLPDRQLFLPQVHQRFHDRSSSLSSCSISSAVRLSVTRCLKNPSLPPWIRPFTFSVPPARQMVTGMFFNSCSLKAIWM